MRTRLVITNTTYAGVMEPVWLDLALKGTLNKTGAAFIFWLWSFCLSAFSQSKPHSPRLDPVRLVLASFGNRAPELRQAANSIKTIDLRLRRA